MRKQALLQLRHTTLWPSPNCQLGTKNMLELVKDNYKQRRGTSIWTKYTAWMILKNKTVLKLPLPCKQSYHLNNAT